MSSSGNGHHLPIQGGVCVSDGASVDPRRRRRGGLRAATASLLNPPLVTKLQDLILDLKWISRAPKSLAIVQPRRQYLGVTCTVGWSERKGGGPFEGVEWVEEGVEKTQWLGNKWGGGGGKRHCTDSD